MGWCAWAYRGSFFFLDLPWWITPFSKRISIHCTAPARLLASLFFINQSTTSRPIKQQGYIRRWYRLSRIIGGSCSLCNRLLKCSPTKMICKALRESWSFIFNNENIKYVPHSQKNCAKSTQLCKILTAVTWSRREESETLKGREGGGWTGVELPLAYRLGDKVRDWALDWVTDSLSDWQRDYLPEHLIDWVTKWRTDWQTEWLADIVGHKLPKWLSYWMFNYWLTIFCINKAMSHWLTGKLLHYNFSWLSKLIYPMFHWSSCYNVSLSWIATSWVVCFISPPHKVDAAFREKAVLFCKKCSSLWKKSVILLPSLPIFFNGHSPL